MDGWEDEKVRGRQARTKASQRGEAGSGKREAGSGKREAGSGKREAGSGKREAGSFTFPAKDVNPETPVLDETGTLPERRAVRLLDLVNQGNVFFARAYGRDRAMYDADAPEFGAVRTLARHHDECPDTAVEAVRFTVEGVAPPLLQTAEQAGDSAAIRLAWGLGRIIGRGCGEDLLSRALRPILWMTIISLLLGWIGRPTDRKARLPKRVRDLLMGGHENGRLARKEANDFPDLPRRSGSLESPRKYISRMTSALDTHRALADRCFLAAITNAARIAALPDAARKTCENLAERITGRKIDEVIRAASVEAGTVDVDGGTAADGVSNAPAGGTPDERKADSASAPTDALPPVVGVPSLDFVKRSHGWYQRVLDAAGIEVRVVLLATVGVPLTGKGSAPSWTPSPYRQEACARCRQGFVGEVMRRIALGIEWFRATGDRHPPELKEFILSTLPAGP